MSCAIGDDLDLRDIVVCCTRHEFYDGVVRVSRMVWLHTGCGCTREVELGMCARSVMLRGDVLLRERDQANTGTMLHVIGDGWHMHGHMV